MKWSRIALPVYWVALAAVTHYPQVRIPGEIPKSDKVVHFAAFGLLAYVLWRFLASRARGLTPASVWVAALVLIPYATLDEYTQQFVGRYTDVVDWVANLVGVISVLAVLEIRRRVRGSRDRAAT